MALRLTADDCSGCERSYLNAGGDAAHLIDSLLACKKVQPACVKDQPRESSAWKGGRRRNGILAQRGRWERLIVIGNFDAGGGWINDGVSGVAEAELEGFVGFFQSVD